MVVHLFANKEKGLPAFAALFDESDAEILAKRFRISNRPGGDDNFQPVAASETFERPAKWI